MRIAKNILGDASFVQVPVAGLIDKAYLAERSASDRSSQGAQRLSGRQPARRDAAHGGDFG
jgi:gamma-glutamyltranspeptidase